jgi:hypothetical protein
VEYVNRHVLRETGQQSVTATFMLNVRPADFEEREAAERRELLSGSTI